MTPPRLVRFFRPDGAEAFFCYAADYQTAREHRDDTMARVAAARTRAREEG